MPIISAVEDYNGFAAKVNRLDLRAIVGEAEAAVTGFRLLVAEEKHANGTVGIREAIDSGFEFAGGWTMLKTGGVDWSKANARGAKVGVEVQVSGRSDMLAVDILHLSEQLSMGAIDAGIIIVPDDRLSRFLTDRTPNLRTAIKHVGHRASDLPMRIMAFAHDGVGPALPKMRTNLGRQSD